MSDVILLPFGRPFITRSISRLPVNIGHCSVLGFRFHSSRIIIMTVVYRIVITLRGGETISVALYRVAQNKIPHRRICNISATSGLILKILEAA